MFRWRKKLILEVSKYFRELLKIYFSFPESINSSGSVDDISICIRLCKWQPTVSVCT